MLLPSWGHFEHKRNYAAALATELAAPWLRFRARAHAPEAPKPATDWRRVLVLGDHHLGDLLYRSCSFAAIQQWFPKADWHILTAPGLDGFVGEGWQAHAAYDHQRRDQIQESTLPPEGFDAVVSTSSWRIQEDLRLALHLGIPNRAALSHKGFSGWITHPLKPCDGLPYPMEIWDLFRQLAMADEPTPRSLRPALCIQETTRAACQEKTRGWTDRDYPTLAVFTTSRQPVEQWPEASFRQVVDSLLGEQWNVVVFGAPGDHERLQRITAGTGARASAGELSFGELAVFLEACHAALCTDSGPRHLANAVGTPVCFFRNLRSDPVGSGVYCEGEADLVPPGLRERTRAGQRNILARIEPDSVCAALRATLGTTKHP